MQRRMLIALFVSIAVFYLWMQIAMLIWPPPPPSTQPAQSQPAGATAWPATGPASQPYAGSAPATQPAFAAATGPSSRPEAVTVIGGKSESPVTLGDAARNNPFPMWIQIDPVGATVREVDLRGYYETVERKRPYRLLEPVSQAEATGEAAPVQSFITHLRIENLKLDIPLADEMWALAPSDANHRVFTIQANLPNGQKLARIIKTYELQPQNDPRLPTYDMGLSVRVENLSGQPLTFILTQQGPVGFRREETRGEDRKVIAALWKDDKIAVKGYTRKDVSKKKIPMGADEGSTRIAWAAASNKYFACIVTPAGRTGSAAPPVFSTLEALDLVASEDPNAEISALTFQYVTRPLFVMAGDNTEVAFKCYLGPKSKRAFQNVPEYARLEYYWVIREGFYACAPAGLVSLMMRLLDAFHAIPPHNYGVAIIILVLVVRVILHPITKRSQVNMTKMQKQMAVLQPKIEAVKKKYANDRVAMNQAMMEVYQEAGINPAGNLLTCLPLMLQIPIWGALWTALASTIEMRHAPFDGFWIKDLAGPDAVLTFRPIMIPLVSYLAGPIHSLNLLPILLGISQYLQARFMPRGAPAAQSGGAPDQLEQQRKMMSFMSVFFVLMLYNAPSGLNLYIMASNFFGILEQWRIRKHIADEEKRPPDGGAGGLGKRPDKPREPSWFERKWKDLQKQVEDAKRIESERGKKKKR